MKDMPERCLYRHAGRNDMSYKIIVDSCGELTDKMKASGCFETASLQIDVNGHHIVDDETFNQAEFLKIATPSSQWMARS